MEIQTEFSLGNTNKIVMPSQNTISVNFLTQQEMFLLNQKYSSNILATTETVYVGIGMSKTEFTFGKQSNGGKKMNENMQNNPNTEGQANSEIDNNLSLDEKDLAIASEEAPAKTSKGKKPVDDDQYEMDINDMGAEWIKNPAVGEETEVLTIKKVMQNKKIDAKRADGQAFKNNLSSVDYKIDIHTDKGIYCPSCWEVWGKIKAAIRKSKERVGTEIVGTKFSIKHLVNGLYASKSVDEVRKLLELPNTAEGLATAEKTCLEAKEAQKNKKCYEVTLYVGDKTVKF